MFRTILIGSALTIYTAGLGAAGYMTLTNSGVSTPKIVKQSVRDRSVGHVRHHSGYRYGK